MNADTTYSFPQKKRKAFLIFLLVSYAISFYLYYVDEGNYHFEGLKQPTEWVFLSMYALIFTGIFGLVYVFVRRLNLSFWGKILTSIFIGIAVLITLVLILFTQ